LQQRKAESRSNDPYPKHLSLVVGCTRGRDGQELSRWVRTSTRKAVKVHDGGLLTGSVGERGKVLLSTTVGGRRGRAERWGGHEEPKARSTVGVYAVVGDQETTEAYEECGYLEVCQVERYLHPTSDLLFSTRG